MAENNTLKLVPVEEERRTVVFPSGKSYQIRSIGEFGLVERHRITKELKALGEELGNLADLPVEAAEALSFRYDSMIAMLVIAPQDEIIALHYGAKEQILTFFVEPLKTLRTGQASSQESSDSMAAAPTIG